jgi:multidrug efflux pump subunit AcrB
MMIAMGMLVDNAIVVTEGMITRIKQGLSPRESAIAAVATTRFPLLAATVIGIAAFAPIGLSNDSTGQFLGSLFTVCGISLLLSWILAITLVPSIGMALLTSVPEAVPESRLYAGRFSRDIANSWHGVLPGAVGPRSPCWLSCCRALSASRS